MRQNLKNFFLFILAVSVMTACQTVPEPDNILEDETTLLSRGNSDRAKGNEFSAFLTGAEEVRGDGEMGVNAKGAGAATFLLSRDGKSISYKIKISKIEDLVFAHIHQGAFGENGPVVVTLIPRGAAGPGLLTGYEYEGTITESDLVGPLAGKKLSDLVKMMEMGMGYVNVHSAEFPAGELRGQISVVRPNDNGNYTTQLTGDQEVHDVDTKARGVGIFRFNNDNTAVSFKVNVAQLENVLFAHIHLAPRGVNGPVVVTLKADRIDGRVNGVYAQGNITQNDLQGLLEGGDIYILRAAFRAGYAYVNVHTVDFPAGELRGQL